MLAWRVYLGICSMPGSCNWQSLFIVVSKVCLAPGAASLGPNFSGCAPLETFMRLRPHMKVLGIIIQCCRDIAQDFTGCAHHLVPNGELISAPS